MARLEKTALKTTSRLCAVALVCSLTACASKVEPVAGVVPENRVTVHDMVVEFEKILMPEWARTRPLPGTLLSPDETYMRERGFDIVAPGDEHIPFMRRPVYVTETGMKLGPKVGGPETYYVKQSYKWHASEEARINVLLADVNRANARLESYQAVADRVLDIEEHRLEAVYEAGLDVAPRKTKETLIAHSIGNRNALAFAITPIPDRLRAYAYAAKRGRIDLPGDPILFAVEAEIATMSVTLTHLQARLSELDQQIMDFLTATPATLDQ